MAYNVKFLKGTASAYAALTAKDANTFYYVDGTDLYLGEIKLSNAADLAEAKAALEASIKTNADDIDVIEGEIGETADLTTTAKTLAGAINELATKIGATGTAANVTLEKNSDLQYTIKQGGETVGTIDIPKDMVVESGSVVVNPEGQPAGTYIKLVLANSSDILYINTTSLVDIYTAKADAAQIQIAVVDNEISATVVAGSIGTTELADAAITTAKIADGNVTKAKLATAVQGSLDKADSAVQSVATGTANGTIAVDGTDVAVQGLGSAAYQNTTAFDAAGAANTVKTELTATINTTQTTLQGNIDAVSGDLATEVSNREALEKKVDDALGSGGNVATQIADAINALDVADTAVSGKYVSAVSETDGKISVTRADLPDWTDAIATAKSEAISTAAADATSKADAALASAKTDATTKADAALASAKEDATTKADAALASAKADATTKADAAESNAKAYTDTALTWGTF